MFLQFACDILDPQFASNTQSEMLGTRGGLAIQDEQGGGELAIRDFICFEFRSVACEGEACFMFGHLHACLLVRSRLHAFQNMFIGVGGGPVSLSNV